MLEAQLIQKSLDNKIIPYAMQILEELIIYCEDIEIKKITSYLKEQFGKKDSLTSSMVQYFLPYSKKMESGLGLGTQAGQAERYMVEDKSPFK